MMEIYLINTGCFDNEPLKERVFKSLPEARREKTEKYRFEKDKRLSIGAGYLQQLALKSAGLENEETVFGENGKPYLKNGGFWFNLSHSGIYAVCAAGTEENGIDVEAVREAGDALIKRVCTPEEQSMLSALDNEKKQDAFFRLWTAKEAYMKLLGTGFSLPPEEIHLVLGEEITLSPRNKGPMAFFKEYPLPGYKLTVCSRFNSFPGKITEIDIEKALP